MSKLKPEGRKATEKDGVVDRRAANSLHVTFEIWAAKSKSQTSYGISYTLIAPDAIWCHFEPRTTSVVRNVSRRMLYWRIYSFVARLSTQKVSRNKMLIIDTTVKYFTENRHSGTTSAICQLSNNPVESLGIVSLYRILGLFLLVFCSMSFVFSFTIFSRRLYLFWPLCTVLSLLLRLLLT